MTTYALPFGGSIRTQSKRRFVLVRDNARRSPMYTGPYVVRRSDNRAVLDKLFQPTTDYIVDAVTREVFYSVNGKREVRRG